MVDPVIAWITALCIVMLFGSAAVGKLVDWRSFLSVLGNYKLLPPPLLVLAAPLVVALEAAVVPMLLLPSSRVVGSYLATCLLGSYAVAIGINLWRGRRNIDCGCLAAGRRRHITGWLVVRNLSLATTAMVAGLPMTSRNLGALDVVTIACTVTTLAVLYAIYSTLSDVAASHARVRP
jgi:hypothetical protein